MDTPTTYLPPRDVYAPVADLWRDKDERALMQACMAYFIDEVTCKPYERDRLARAYERYGAGIFIWKYYCAARCYLGGVKSLTAHIKLKRLP